MFTPRCPPGPGALDCVAGRIDDLAVFLDTPRGLGDDLQQIFAHPAPSLKP
jgi:hypothetical protein